MPATTSRLRRTALILAAALVCSGLLAGPAHAGPPTAAATPPVDVSGSMPRVSRGEITYDFLGRGYQQRLIAENGNLNLYDAPGRGSGTPIKSVPLDLAPPPLTVNTDGGRVSMYDTYSNEGDLSCWGCLEQRAVSHGYNAIYLAVLDGSLYISGTKGSWWQKNPQPGFPQYANLLYKAPLDLSCARSTCLPPNSVVKLPTTYNEITRPIGTTSLAGGYVGGNPYLAVGLTDEGAFLYDTNLHQVSNYTGMTTEETAQTPVISLAFDPAGSGKLGLGVMSYGNDSFLVDVAPNGSLTGAVTCNHVGHDQLYSSPASVTFGRRPNGGLLVAFGTTSDGWSAGLVVFDGLSCGDPLQLFAMPGSGSATVQTWPRLDGTTGDDFAVWSESGYGSVIRYDQGTNTLSYLPLQPESTGKANQLDLGQFRAWFPGFKTGRFSVVNTLPEPVSVTLQTRPQAGYGCWYAPAFADAPAFPTSAVTVPPGATSPVFTMGGLTAGAQGLCGAEDITSVIRGYLVITPQSRPADVRIVDLQLEKETLSVDVAQDTAGGSTTVTATRAGDAAAFGAWTVTVGGPAAPTPVAAPTIAKARQITTNIRNRSTVYRIDLNGTSWNVPGVNAASPQVQAVIPPLQVQARVDANSAWDTVGTFLAPGSLSASGTTVTTSTGTFFWENPTGAKQYSQLQVLAGGLASKTIDLTSLSAPTAPAVAISKLQLNAMKTNSSMANVVPSGIDQAQVNVQISAGSPTAQLLPTSDPAYDTVYYRDEDNDLITNLYLPGQFDQYVGVQPAAGAYPNTAVSTLRRPPVGSGLSFDYIATNDLAQRTVTGWVGLGSPRSDNSAQINLNDQPVNITPDPNAKAGSGFSLEGCTDFVSGPTCLVAPATASRPALYQAGSGDTGPLLGAHLRLQGQNAVSDLPLQWQVRLGAQDLATSGLSLGPRSTLIKLTNADGFLPGNDVDLTVVSHGQSVAATVPVS